MSPRRWDHGFGSARSLYLDAHSPVELEKNCLPPIRFDEVIHMSICEALT